MYIDTKGQAIGRDYCGIIQHQRARLLDISHCRECLLPRTVRSLASTDISYDGFKSYDSVS